MSRTFEAGLQARTTYGSAAFGVLSPTMQLELEQHHSFIVNLQDEKLIELIEDKELGKKVFADVLNYAINGGFMDQATISEAVSYEKSQVGRWKNGEAAPPVLVRKLVISEVLKIARRRHDFLRDEIASHAREQKGKASQKLKRSDAANDAKGARVAAKK